MDAAVPAGPLGARPTSAAAHRLPHSEPAWCFPDTPKLSPIFGRTVPAAETERRIRRVAARIPITRITDLSPLDRLRLPVFAAVTPCARDLTTHLGKGHDATAARVSALMEAVERTSAECAPPGSTLRASYWALAADAPGLAIDPTSLDLPSDSRYAPEHEYTWMRGRDLLAHTDVLLPADLVLNPPGEGILHEVDTNGLAAGNTLLEAVVHGLCEVIERDAQGQIEFHRLFAAPHDAAPLRMEVDPATLPDSARAWVEKLQAHGLELAIHDITGDVEVATFWALLCDYRYPTTEGAVPLLFGGAGTAPHAEAALLRAITEAVQARVARIQGARDSFNMMPVGQRAASRSAHLGQLIPGRRVPFARTPSIETTDLRQDLSFLLARLAAAGIERVLAFELTRADLGIPVVRIRIPGLSSFLVNRRRVGWRCLRYLLSL